MAMIPVSYNLRSMLVRYGSTAVAILGIAGVVAVFVAMLSMARGFTRTLKSTGSPDNAIVLRAGSTSEMDSAVNLDQVRIIGDAPGVARDNSGQALTSPEVVVIAAIPLIKTGTDANVQIRGVSEQVLRVRDNVRIAEGRMLIPGKAELVVGRNASRIYSGMKLGDRPSFGGLTWTVVGIMESGGSAFDSETWADSAVLNQAYKRPVNIYQSVTVKLANRQSFTSFKDALTKDPRLSVNAEREVDYYARKSEMVATLIRVLGFMVAIVMGIGAVFAALNTMYAAVSARVREVATLRAMGFGSTAVILSFLAESILISLIGGIIGCIVILPLNGYTASTINWSTFSHLAFAFRITPDIMISGIVFALFMGFVGGLFPSIRAARLPVAVALREL